MSMTPVKPPGFYGRDVGRDLLRFSRPGEQTAPVGVGPVIQWTAVAVGDLARITIMAMPEPVDAVYWGDGRGRLVDTAWRVGAQEGLLGSIQPGTFDVPLFGTGSNPVVSVEIAAVDTLGPGPFTTRVLGEAPVNLAPPVIAGTGEVGQTLTAASDGTWAGTPAPALVRNWQRDGVDIPGEAGATYTLTEADEDASVRLRVTAFGSVSVTVFSNAISVVGVGEPPPPDPEPEPEPTSLVFAANVYAPGVYA